MNITRAIENATQKLVKCRYHDEQFQIKPMGVKGAKFQNADINQYTPIKTRTIKCMFVNHAISTKKTFKAGQRYQIEQGRVLGGVAGYVFDEDGDRWTLYREEAGFSAGAGVYLFEAKYF